MQIHHLSRSFSRLGVLCLLGLAGSACSAPAPNTGTPGDGGAVVDGLVPPDNGPEFGKITGTVIDLNSQPVANASVTLRGVRSYSASTDASGVYAAYVSPATYGLHVELPKAAPTEYAQVVIPIYNFDPVQTPVRAVKPIVLPRLGTATPLTGGKQTVVIDSTLSLTVDAGSLTLPPGSGAQQLAGVRVPSTLYPDFCLPSGDGRVLAEWALGPFDTTSSASIDVHLADGLGLAPGSSVMFLSIDPLLGRPQVEGSGTVSADGKSIDSAPMQGMRTLTWLIVAVPGTGA